MSNKGFIGSELLRFKTNQKYCSYDFETCSLSLLNAGSLSNNRPTQIGYTIWEGKKLVKTVQDWIWFPEVEELMSKEASAITRFDWQEYKSKAIPPKEALEKFEKYALNEDYLLLGANLHRFDIYIWSILRTLCGKDIVWNHLDRTICVQVLAKAIHLQVAPPPIGSKDWLSFSFKMADWHKRGVKTNLKYLMTSNDLPYDEQKHHFSASYDTEMVKMIFDKQMYSLEIGF